MRRHGARVLDYLAGRETGIVTREPSDPFNLRRFVEAQEPVYAKVCAELRAGHKTSHWIWFIFPQLRGLGRSPMANKFGIASRQEAEAYLTHPLLGPRLRECTRLVNAIDGLSISEIFGYPDDLKFRSSITLFASIASGGGGPFHDSLGKYFGGEPDPLTLARL